LHETARDVAVVILEEHDSIFESGFAAELVNFLDESAPAFIARMRFAGKYELHRTRGVVEQPFQSLFIAKQKRAAFVGREPSRETDRQNFGIEDPAYIANRFGRVADTLPATAHPFSHQFHQPMLQLLARFPQLR